MRALVLRDFDGPEGLRLDDVPAPDGEAGTVRIEVHAAGVSFADLLITRGLYQVKPPLPFVPGLEVAGVVTAAPAGSGFEAGARVAAHVFGGAFAEDAIADPAMIVPVPDNVTFAVAAGLVVNYQTAWFALVRRARLEAGERVLVHGAGGGLGTATVGVAKALGAEVVGVAAAGAKTEMAASAGADCVVDPSGADWAERVRAASGGEGVDVVVDPVGGDRFDDTLRLLRPEGRLVVVGFTGGSIPAVKVNRLLLRNVSVLGAAWREFLSTEPAFFTETGALLGRLVADGRLVPRVGACYPLAEGARALQDLADRRTAGKVVLEVR